MMDRLRDIEMKLDDLEQRVRGLERNDRQIKTPKPDWAVNGTTESLTVTTDGTASLAGINQALRALVNELDAKGVINVGGASS